MELAKTRYTAAGLDDLVTIRQFIENTVTAVSHDQDGISELILAANEAVTNVIVHGYQGQPGAIEITIEGNDRHFSVHIRDQAPFFDPTSVPPPDITRPLEKRPYGGMGVHMMRQFVDNLSYRAISSGGNELILEKELA
jgi:serine/threonine-protein kinase RsbW